MKDEEMATEKLSNLSKVTLLVIMAGLDPYPGQTDSGGCVPNHCTAEESRQLQFCNKTFGFFKAYISLFVFPNGLLFIFNGKKMYKYLETFSL